MIKATQQVYSVKKNKGIAIHRIRECMAEGKPFIHSFSLSKSTQKWVERTMTALIATGDNTVIINYPEPLESIALSLIEHDDFTTIEVRHVEGVPVYVIEKNQKQRRK